MVGVGAGDNGEDGGFFEGPFKGLLNSVVNVLVGGGV